MEIYGGKNSQKKREETRERVLREKANFIKNLFLILSFLPLIGTAGYLGYQYISTVSWNENILAITKKAWNGMDTLEEDVMNAALFMKGCRNDLILQEIPNGFQINTINTRNMSMEILQNQPIYSEQALMAYLGSGVTTGDELVLCNKEEERKLKLKVIRNNPKYGYHYLMFEEEIKSPAIPTNLIKFTPVIYTWEKLSDGTEKLLRKVGGKESEILSGVQSHSMNYSFAGESAHITLDIALTEKFPGGQNIHVKRHIPLRSFQRMPRELEDKIP